MSTEDADDVYLAVVNHEEQFSIWRDGRPLPDGWRPAGFRGRRDECLDHIAEVWTDMRPLSLRRWLAQQDGAAHRHAD